MAVQLLWKSLRDSGFEAHSCLSSDAADFARFEESCLLPVESLKHRKLTVNRGTDIAFSPHTK